MSSRRRKALSPSLFPFLAVLVCTLGTLILLLALVSQNAATAATAQAEAKEAEAAAKQAAAAKAKQNQTPRMSGAAAASLIAEEAFRVEQLVSFRQQQTADMERRRGQLAQVESHMKRLQDELKKLSDQADIATGEKDADAVDPGALARLREKVQAESEKLDELSGDGAAKAPLVALIPFKGPNGTDRRPVYLECTAEGMTIWPEGAKLTVGHLEESVDGANPLDDALKVVRHHIMQNYGDAVPPYPLLVVRPDGIDTYAAARIALQDWDDQFGYELVPAEVQLAYGTPDAILKKRLDEVIRLAITNQHGMRALAKRARQGYRQSGAIEGNKRYPRLSAAAMDRRGRSSGYNDHRETSPSRSAYRSNQFSGGNGSSGSDIAQALDRHLREAKNELQNGGLEDSLSDSSLAASKTASPEAGTALAALADNMPTSSLPSRIRPNQFVDPQLARDGMLERQGNPFSLPGGVTVDSQSGAATPYNGDSDTGRSDLAMRMPQNASLSNAAPPESKFQMPLSSPQASDPSASDPSASDPRASDPRASDQRAAGAPSQSMSLNQSANPSHDELARQAELQQRAAEEAATRASMDSQSDNQNQSTQNQSATRQMVDRDSEKWALPRSVASSRGNSIVRTIRVQCYPGRLVLVASARGGATEMFGLADDDMSRATLELASAVRDRIDRWGAAIPGGRWQPRLDVEVMPGGENRYYQLQRMMSGSGVDVVGRHSENATSGAAR